MCLWHASGTNCQLCYSITTLHAPPSWAYWISVLWVRTLRADVCLSTASFTRCTCKAWHQAPQYHYILYAGTHYIWWSPGQVRWDVHVQPIGPEAEKPKHTYTMQSDSIRLPVSLCSWKGTPVMEDDLFLHSALRYLYCSTAYRHKSIGIIPCLLAQARYRYG